MSFCANTVLVASVGVALTGIAVAAETQDTNDELVLEAVVVTGSRVQSTLTPPAPIQSISAEALESKAPVMSDALLQMPTFKNSQGARTQAQSNLRNSGAALLNLRGLGVERSLVLVNGRRYITFANLGAVDVDMIPQDIVKRVDVVTGGASAAYGSDAVAGVVNFILDDEMEGGRVTVRSGISDRGDGDMQAAAASWGGKFAGGAGHLVLSADYFNQEEIGHPQGRAWADEYWTVIANGPRRVIAQPNHWASNAPGGLITSGVLAGQQFMPDGTLAPFVNGQYKGSLYMIGGSGVPQEVPLMTGIERWSSFARASYDLSEDVKVWSELTYAQAVASVHTQHPQIQGNDAFTIFSDNAFLPAAVRAQLAGQPSFRMARTNRDFGVLYNNVRTRAMRFTTGLDWDISSRWQFAVYAMHGQSWYRNLDSGLPIRRNLYAAADAVVDPSTNQIVCRATLSGLMPGCVPINLFGEGAPSRAALDYILGTSRADMVFKENVASMAISGSPFALPAGEVQAAFGLEYRREDADQKADPISTTINTGTGIRGFPATLDGVLGGFPFANQVSLVGTYDVKEGFFEAELPLLKQHPLAQRLSFNGAVRAIDYSTADDVVMTWKTGVVYEPIADVLLRATRSRDIRAGTITELFAPVSRATVFVTRNGSTVQAANIRSGNRELDPEVADTTTAGIVYRPAFAPDLTMSVDLYRIAMKDAIASLTPQATVDQCAAGNAVVCQQISDDAGGLVIRTVGLNLASLKTEGLDIQVDYGFDLGSGRIGAQLTATHIHKLETTVPGSAPIDRAGDITIAATPKWSGALSLGYLQGPFTLNVQERFIGSGAIDVTFTPSMLPNNRVPAIFYTDLTARYRLGSDSNYEIFGTVNNVFGKDPPIAPTALAGVYRSTQAALYDVIGRYMTLGFRVTF